MVIQMFDGFCLHYLIMQLDDNLKGTINLLIFGIGTRPNIFKISGNIPSEKERFSKKACLLYWDLETLLRELRDLR